MAVETKQLDGGISVVTISGRLALGGETEKLDAAVSRILAADGMGHFPPIASVLELRGRVVPDVLTWSAVTHWSVSTNAMRAMLPSAK